MQIFKSVDDMCNIRHNIKRVYKTPVLGHMCVINSKRPMYSFLKEWYLLPDYKINMLKSESLIWGFPHVIVFDLDSTLITEEKNIQIRDLYVYESLQELRDIGCVLILWSYGSKHHVLHSMKKTNLFQYFDVIISEGATVDANDSSSTLDVVDYKKQFVKSTFDYDIVQEKQLPKSPKIVIKYLKDKNVNFFKSITLVDDLDTNNFAYDFYVKVNRCPVPVNDWQQYHDTILQNFEKYDYNYT